MCNHLGGGGSNIDLLIIKLTLVGLWVVIIMSSLSTVPTRCGLWGAILSHISWGENTVMIKIMI